ncbi:hypothetical protein CSUI_007888, partial [Cystoisospora suis]
GFRCNFICVLIYIDLLLSLDVSISPHLCLSIYIFLVSAVSLSISSLSFFFFFSQGLRLIRGEFITSLHEEFRCHYLASWILYGCLILLGGVSHVLWRCLKAIYVSNCTTSLCFWRSHLEHRSCLCPLPLQRTPRKKNHTCPRVWREFTERCYLDCVVSNHRQSRDSERRIGDSLLLSHFLHISYHRASYRSPLRSHLQVYGSSYGRESDSRIGAASSLSLDVLPHC